MSFLKSWRGRKTIREFDFGNSEFGYSEFGNSDFGIREFGNRELGIREFGKLEFTNSEFGIREFGVEASFLKSWGGRKTIREFEPGNSDIRNSGNRSSEFRN